MNTTYFAPAMVGGSPVRRFSNSLPKIGRSARVPLMISVQTVVQPARAALDITNTKKVRRLATVCSSFASTAFQGFLPD
jgi:hypothetical protein